MLRDLAAAADIRLGACCLALEQNGQRVKALLSDGTAVEGDLLLEASDPVSALRNYETRRIRRANSFVPASGIFGRMFQLESDLRVPSAESGPRICALSPPSAKRPATLG